MSVVVLIADDLPVTGRLVTTLGAAGIEVLKADCSRSAVALANSTPACTAIVSDKVLSASTSGGHTAGQALQAAADLPFILISGNDEHWHRREMAGWKRSISKRFDLEQLVQALRELAGPGEQPRS
jgi:DNA-binding NtrC family response regulator